MINHKDINIIATMKRMAYGEADLFSFEDGFNIAVAFTAYDNEQEWTLEPKYGELYFDAYSWGTDDEGNFFTKYERMETAVCTRE